jgi:hypothetical protein
LITINADCCFEVAQPSGSHLTKRSLRCCEIGLAGTGDLTRAQLVMPARCDQIHLSEEDRWRYKLDDRTRWRASFWRMVHLAEPAAQEMLRRLKAAFKLMVMAEQVRCNPAP